MKLIGLVEPILKPPPSSTRMVKSFRGRSLASSVRSSQEDSAPVLDPSTDFYAKVIESRGKGQFVVSLPKANDSSETSESNESSETSDSAFASASVSTSTPNSSATLLVYMPPKFRNALWIRRGSFVIIKKYEEDKGELVHVLSTEQIKEIRKEGGWPKEFENEFSFESESEEESDDMISEDSSDEYCSSEYGSED